MQINTMTIDNEANTTLTVYLHEEKPEFHRIDKRPFILVIPGGGYGFCSEREAEPIALKFAAEGYHAGVLRYHVGEHRDFHKALADAEKSMDLIALLAEKAKIDRFFCRWAFSSRFVYFVRSKTKCLYPCLSGYFKLLCGSDEDQGSFFRHVCDTANATYFFVFYIRR